MSLSAWPSGPVLRVHCPSTAARPHNAHHPTRPTSSNTLWHRRSDGSKSKQESVDDGPNEEKKASPPEPKLKTAEPAPTPKAGANPVPAPAAAPAAAPATSTPAPASTAEASSKKPEADEKETQQKLEKFNQLQSVGSKLFKGACGLEKFNQLQSVGSKLFKGACGLEACSKMWEVVRWLSQRWEW